MEFLHPQVLWLGLAVPAFLYVRLRRKEGATPMPGLSGMSGLPATRLHRAPPVLLALACLLLVFSAAGPRVEAGPRVDKLLGVDVALALDVSASMRAEDLKPNRMEAAKAKVKEFAGSFSEGRMSLVAFAGRSFTKCPLTSDAAILEGLIDQLDVGTVTINGTAIGDAILNCLNRFKDPAASRVIILLTDGENNSGTADPLTAARAARAAGVKIYAIVVGTPEGAPVPAFGPDGRKYYLRDQAGNLALAKADEATLREVASITGGTFFRAGDEDALGKIYARIAEMEKSELAVKRMKSYRELFPYPAGAALVLSLIGGALGAARLRVLR